MAIAAGEYGYDALYFRRMLPAEAVDVQQADATRCAGITGFMQADALCESHCDAALRPYVLRRSTRTPAVRHSAPSIPNTSSITFVLRKWRSKARLKQEPARCGPISHSLGFGLVWKERDMSRFQVFGGQVASA